MSSAPPLAAGPPKPHFLADEHSEKVWNVVLALTTELAATRARLDALERALMQRGSLPPGGVEAWQPTEQDGVERTRDLQAYMQRVFETLGRD